MGSRLHGESNSSEQAGKQWTNRLPSILFDGRMRLPGKDVHQIAERTKNENNPKIPGPHHESTFAVACAAERRIISPRIPRLIRIVFAVFVIDDLAWNPHDDRKNGCQYF